MSRNFSAEDIGKIKGIGEAKISPNSNLVAYTLRYVNTEENRYATDLYIVPTEGGKAKRLTEDGRATLPVWSPDGRWIAYAQGEKDCSAIIVTDPEEGNKRRITSYCVGNAFLGLMAVGETLQWSPDGSKIGYLATLEPFERDAKIKVITRLRYKSFYGFSDMRRRHIFIASVLGNEAPRQLTFGDYDEHSIAWSPEGQEIAFVSNRSGDDDLNMHTDIWAVDVATKEIRRITETLGAEYYPNYSPDGSKIAYIATTRGDTSEESTPEDQHLWVVDRDGSNPIDLVKSLDRQTNTPPMWLNNRDLLVTATDDGRTPIIKVSIDGEVSKFRTGDRTYSHISVARNGTVAYTYSDFLMPEELYSYTTNGVETKLTENNAWLRDIDLVEPEEFWFTTSDGAPIHGWMVKPLDLDPTKKYPTLLYIKGGPSGMHGHNFSFYHQLAAAHGFVQIYVNYRGCSGYGQAFTDAIVGDMLGVEYRDNIEGLDYAIKSNEFIDPERLGIWGGSYGGYLTNWIITQTQRFKAAVSISSISNLWSDWGCSSVPLWVEVELPGKPWEHPDKMIKQSPIWQAHKVRTPTLFLNGEMDFCTPISEAEQMFMVLKKMGVEAMMVRYVEEGHSIRIKPINMVDAMRRAMAWFESHLKNSAALSHFGPILG